MDIELIAIGLAWVGIALMLAWGAVVALFRLFADVAGPLPFFVMIERQGVNARSSKRPSAPEAWRARCADARSAPAAAIARGAGASTVRTRR